MAWRPTYNFDLHAGAGPRLGPRRGERLRRVETPGTETPERLPGGQPRGARTPARQNEGRYWIETGPDRAARSIIDPDQVHRWDSRIYGARDAPRSTQRLFKTKENRDVRRIFIVDRPDMWGPLPKPPSEFYASYNMTCQSRPSSLCTRRPSPTTSRSTGGL